MANSLQFGPLTTASSQYTSLSFSSASPARDLSSFVYAWPAPRLEQKLPRIRSNAGDVLEGVRRRPPKFVTRASQGDGENSKGEEEKGAVGEGRDSDRKRGFWQGFWGQRRGDDKVKDEEKGPSAQREEIDRETETEGLREEMDKAKTYVTPDLEPQDAERDREPKREAEQTSFWGGLWGQREKETTEDAADFETEAPFTSEEVDLILEGADMEIQWRDLLDPTLENVLALLLTALLAFAVLQIAWQLLVVAASITLSALKYSVLAAILLGILIFLI